MIKFLADVNIEKPIVEFLKNSGYDITWIPDYDPSMSDQELLNMAVKEDRILLTNDKDFGYFIFLQKKRLNGIILFRIKGQKTEDKLNNLRELLDKYDDKISKYFIVITEKKIRFTPLR
jgi:predicted nuclease of predicted toxin-antitoxin system